VTRIIDATEVDEMVDSTNIRVKRGTVRKLQYLKWFFGLKNHDEVINRLIDEAGVKVPERGERP